MKMTKADKIELWKQLEAGEFAAMIKESAPGKTVSNMAVALNVLRPLYAEEPDVEQVYMIFLNAGNRILAIESVAKGTLSSSAVYPREIAKKILYHKAAAIIMSHNHPSGDPSPSTEDLDLTKRIMLMTKTISVSFHDHMIIGHGGAYCSMNEVGTLGDISESIENFLNSL